MHDEPAAAHPPLTRDLARVLTLRDLVLIVVGTTIGPGIFTVPGSVLRQSGGERASDPFRNSERPNVETGVTPSLPETCRARVNSSHHQAAAGAGDGLRIVARCPEDGVIEALEGTAPNHFVLAVQWHPERMPEDPFAQELFRNFVAAARY